MFSVLRLWIRSYITADDRGATMVEYGLLIVLIALVAAVGAFALGQGLDGLFVRIKNCLATPSSGCTPAP